MCEAGDMCGVGVTCCSAFLRLISDKGLQGVGGVAKHDIRE